MNKLKIRDEVILGGHFKGDMFDLFQVTGEDRTRYMQGQLTADLKSISTNEGLLNTRLTQHGKVVSYLYYLVGTNCDYMIVPKETSVVLKSDLEKFIIMDDVEITTSTNKAQFSFGLESFSKKDENDFRVNIFDEPGVISIVEEYEDLEFLDENKLEQYAVLTGYPVWNKTVKENEFINDSRLNELAISYKKGCFLGQETVAKINNNRGAAYYPTLLEFAETNQFFASGNILMIEERKGGEVIGSTEVDGKNYVLVKLYRDFRVDKKKLEVSFENKKLKATVHYAPLFGSFDKNQKAEYYYDHAISLFQNDEEQMALKYLYATVQLKPDFADAYEVIGVILGRHEKYNEGIEYMDKLLAVDESSVMAHTNKSLYLMKLGKIEEAEEQKSMATVKTFERLGKEAAAKRAAADEAQKRDAEIERRESMFKQVLEIDENDVLANYGMADIYFYRKNYSAAIEHLDVVLAEDAQYSNGYYLLGKCLLETGNTVRAKDVLEKGVVVASKRGDMMPANGMQSLLNSIN